jgi:glycosyltransferase involved in cell wall biosynthesis
VHLLNGDEQLDLLLRRRQLLSCPLVATFHLPTNRVRERFEEFHKHLVSGIDVAVVVARSQLPDFANWLGPDRVVYVPHGIDTDQFSPGEGTLPRDGLRLLTVGHHMRDWKAIDEIIDKSTRLGLTVRFDIVASEHGLSGSFKFANVHFHKGVPEECLIQLYREADALLLPVRDATATNAALEALACGTPVITTMVGGMPDYVDSTCGWLFEKGEVDGIVQLVSEICSRPEIAWARRGAARDKALGFSWERVAAAMRIIYTAAAHRRLPELVAPEWR